MFNYGKCSQRMPFLRFFLHRLLYVMCLKCSLSAQMRVLSHEYHWSMDALFVRCSMLCQTFISI